MSTTDQLLDIYQREVEYEGTSHAKCVFLNDFSFTIPRFEYENPRFSTTYRELFDADLYYVVEDFNSPECWKNLTVINTGDGAAPRVLSVQFIETPAGTVNITANLSSCDMYGELPDDVVSANLLLLRFCDETGANPGELQFNVGVSYTLYTDMEYVEEGIIDWGD